MFLVLMALLLKDCTNVHVPTRISKGHQNTNMCTEVSSDVTFVKENASVLLVCPFLEEERPMVWRGPPNLTIYGIKETINGKLTNLKHKAFITKNEKSQYILKIGMFSKNNQGLYRCDTVKDKKPIEYQMNAIIAESPAVLTLVSDNSSDILTGEEGIPLKVRCYVEDGLPGPTLYLSYQEQVVNVTNTSMLEYLFVPSKGDHLNCFTCAADNEFFNVQTSILLFVEGQPECLHDNNQITSSINEDISISFNVYNPSGHLYLKCLDNMYNTFINCSMYNLLVQDNYFSIQSCNRSFMIAGYVIRVTVCAKLFQNIKALVMNLENKYGNQNCTFNFQANGQSF
ncbi:unnamed protein product [Mytilus coruscus]|uniref:Ig-like domain-containing protein n=1 Tax=Mytilus coruscus TaxID=42192 RepID=A0A6J8AV77_MYTCO|nr:unnamed protein product [Mytilus coruscus]